MTHAKDSAVCRSCGACCATERDWPRFTTEEESELELIPPAYADHARGRMRCYGDRCAALAGEVGIATSCRVYEVRPEVCRACEPGDDACSLARRHWGLPPLHLPG
ncbi:MAG TPA: YkgJ family cysteine cluster protein [Hyphomicrobiaceae bacterium]|nr:YkgJ family cysteine cluster protein [Hyphomicrobiaceae bacterium]